MPQITESQFQDSYQEQDLRFINAMEIIERMRHKDTFRSRTFSVEILPNDRVRWSYYLWSEELQRDTAELCFQCDGDGWIESEITWDGDVSRPDRSAPRRWRRAGSEGAIVQFQLLRRRAAEGSIGFPRHIRDLTGKVVLIQQDEEVVQGPLVIGGTQGSDGEVWLVTVGDMAHGMDKPAEAATWRRRR